MKKTKNDAHQCPLHELKNSCFYQIFEEYENELRELDLSALTLIFNQMINAMIRQESFDLSTLKDLKFIINDYLDNQSDRYDEYSKYENNYEQEIN